MRSTQTRPSDEVPAYLRALFPGRCAAYDKLSHFSRERAKHYDRKKMEAIDDRRADLVAAMFRAAARRRVDSLAELAVKMEMCEWLAKEGWDDTLELALPAITRDLKRLAQLPSSVRRA